MIFLVNDESMAHSPSKMLLWHEWYQISCTNISGIQMGDNWTRDPPCHFLWCNPTIIHGKLWRTQELIKWQIRWCILICKSSGQWESFPCECKQVSYALPHPIVGIAIWNIWFARETYRNIKHNRWKQVMEQTLSLLVLCLYCLLSIYYATINWIRFP